jgi:predicted MPP superfamily phosphohydrolase
MQLTIVVSVYNIVMLGLLGLVILWFRRNRSLVRFLGCAATVLVVGLVLALVASPANPLRAARLVCWGWFAIFPLFLVVVIILGHQTRSVSWGIAVGGLAVTLAIAAQAFLIEPFRLEVTHVTVSSSKLERSLRIALLADFQTDVFGEYQRKSLQALMNERPDVIMMAGDYLQSETMGGWEALRDQMNAYLKEINFSAPAGIYGVTGNTDYQRWPEIFRGLDVTAFTETSCVETDEFVVTGLEMLASFQTTNVIRSREKFQIVLGHAPDFALGDVDADLLLAGHTHGGQVCLPLIGPVVTFSEVPKSWASGVTRIDDDTTLVVSRGVGMERRDAPRLRFLCRPQIIIIDVQPVRP